MSARPRPSEPAPTGPAVDAEAERAAARAAFYLAEAVRAVETALGPGQAAAQPAVLAALVQAAAIERAVALGRDAAREMRDAVVSLKPRLF